MTPEQGVYTIAYGMHREKGPVRQENQDQIVHFQSSVYGHLFVVADGMGGHEGGQMAANMAITGFKQHFQNVSLKLPLRESIAEAARLTNLDIYDMSNARGNGSNPLRMGSTLVLAVISGTLCTVANAGDSRCYLFRDGQLTKLTKDHTAAQKMVDSGIISQEDAKNHPEGSVLTRAFGQRPEVELDIYDPFPLAPGERLLLCSDGLYGYVDESAIADRMNRHSDPQAAADALLQLALDAGGHDNISIFVVRVDPPSLKAITAPDAPEEVAASPAAAVVPPVRPAAAPAAAPAAPRKSSGAAKTLAVVLLLVAVLFAGGAAVARFRPDLVPAPARDQLARWGLPITSAATAQAGPAGDPKVVPVPADPKTEAPAAPAALADEQTAPPAATPGKDPATQTTKDNPVKEVAPAKPEVATAAGPGVFITFPPTDDGAFLKGVNSLRDQLTARGYRTSLSKTPLQQAVWRPLVPHPETFNPRTMFMSALFVPGSKKDAVTVCEVAICSEKQPHQLTAPELKTFSTVFPRASVILFVHPISKQPNTAPAPAPAAPAAESHQDPN